MIETISYESLEERDRYLKKGFAEEFAEMASAVSRAICSGRTKDIFFASEKVSAIRSKENGKIGMLLDDLYVKVTYTRNIQDIENALTEVINEKRAAKAGKSGQNTD